MILNLSREKTLEIIEQSIDDIKKLTEENNLPPEKIKNLENAVTEYDRMYEEAKIGRLDPEILHENIASFLYVME